MQNLRWKIITIVSILIIFTLVGVYPILAAWKHLPSPGWLQEKQLKLGLDLKGGVHLVLRVQTDDALRIETETEMERLRAELQTRNIPAPAAPASTRSRCGRTSRPISGTKPWCRRARRLNGA